MRSGCAPTPRAHLRARRHSRSLTVKRLPASGGSAERAHGRCILASVEHPLRLAWEVAVWLTLLPLLWLSVHIMKVKPGAGPQGGEVLFCGVVLVAGWLVVASAVSSLLCSARVAGPPVVRFLLVPAAAVTVTAVAAAAALVLFNRASLAEGGPTLSRVQNLLGILALVLVVTANGVGLRFTASARQGPPADRGATGAPQAGPTG